MSPIGDLELKRREAAFTKLRRVLAAHGQTSIEGYVNMATVQVETMTRALLAGYGLTAAESIARENFAPEIIDALLAVESLFLKGSGSGKPIGFISNWRDKP